MTKPTKEQLEKFDDAVRYNHNERIYNCRDCKIKLKGMEKVHDHAQEHHHHSYSIKGSKLILGIG